MRKDSAKEENLKFFKLISLTISMWARRVLHEHQPIGIIINRYDNDYIENSMTQHYIGLMKIVKMNQDFGITLSLKLSLLKMTSFMVLLIGTREWFL